MTQLLAILGITKRPLIWVLILLYIPWVILVLLGYFLIAEGLNYTKEVIGFWLFSSLFFMLYLAYNRGRIRQFIGGFGALVLGFFCFVKLSFYLHYGSKISVSALFVIFETNQTEASDFLQNFFSLKVIVLALLFVGYWAIALRFFYKNTHFTKIKGLSLIGRSLGLLVVLACMGFGIQWKFQEENIPLTVVSSWGEYKVAKQQLKQQLASPLGLDFKVKKDSNKPKTIVVILGESTSRRNMSLYGYDRPTNPLLAKQKDELIVFDSVISPHVHTILAVDKILTLNSFTNPNLKENVSVVQLANQAGFKTYWISGQRPVGINESVPTIIGSAADKKIFINTDDYKDVFYDQQLLAPVSQAIQDSAKHKVIFVHLMGTHVSYKKRYPDSFSFFRDNSATEKQQFINQYDNAVRYNDSIVDSIIKMLKGTTNAATLVYFSDHGDDVYLEHDAIGHNEYRPTRPMYQVPFISWSNATLFKENKSRTYSLEDFPHTFAQLCNFSFKGVDYSRSMFSLSYKERKRIIKDSIDYDSNW